MDNEKRLFLIKALLKSKVIEKFFASIQIIQTLEMIHGE